LKQKYTGYRYVYFISPSNDEWHHIISISVYLYIDDTYIKNEQHSFNHKFKSYMPSKEDIEALKPIAKEYIHGVLTKKYKGITLLLPKQHSYIWDSKVNKV